MPTPLNLPLGVEQEFFLENLTNNQPGHYPDFSRYQHLVPLPLEKETNPLMVEVGAGIDDTPQGVADTLRQRRRDLLIVSTASSQVPVPMGMHPTMNLLDAPKYQDASPRYGRLLAQYGESWLLTTCSMHIHVGINKFIAGNLPALLGIFREELKRLKQLLYQHRDKITSIHEFLSTENAPIPFVLNGGNEDLITYILQDWLVREANKYAWVFEALSSNSPFLDGRDRGNINERLQTLQRLPVHGLMSFTDVEEHLAITIEMMWRRQILNPKEFWWFIRSHPFLPTIENRVCDIPLVDEDAVALTALAQALTSWLLRELLARGQACFTSLPLLLSGRNMAEIALRGLHGSVVDVLAPEEYLVPARVAINRLIEQVRPEADDLGSSHYLDYIQREICVRGPGSYLQRGWAEQVGGALDVVSRNLIEAAVARLHGEHLDWTPARDCLMSHRQH